VLILDEPSAALDPASERQIVEGYRVAMKGRTTIVISHRLDVIRAADHIVMIEGARVVERGTPTELSSSGGAFSKLFRT
jgi:ATP-binding cassette, subfamily B, bacterial